MKKSLVSLTYMLICALLISCQKENSSTPASSDAIVGSYKFVSMEMSGVSTTIATNGTDVERAVAVTKYRTKNNAGMVNITSSTFSSVNLSYEIDTIIAVSYYTNGTLEFEMETPFQFVVAPSSSTSSYTVITRDSIYFSSGSMFINGSTQATQASGARIKREGNLLHLIAPARQTKTENNQGIPVTMNFNGIATITLQKQ